MGWHLVGHSGRTVWSVHRQTPPYLSVRNADVVTDLRSSYYWNAPGSYLGNKVGNTHENNTFLTCCFHTPLENTISL